jgi:CRISPR-associated protein Csx17
LLAEGRADWDGRPARSGLDFARAIATLGVDRGIAAFERHLFVDRLGQNPLAVPAGRIKVRRRRGVELLAGLDGWLGQLRRAELPSQVATRLRIVEQALFAHARSGGPGQLVEVIAAVGSCHEAVARSGRVRQAVRPLVMPGGPALLDELWELVTEDVELQIALALATARDKGTAPALPLRTLLSPITAERFPHWTGRPALTSLISGPAAALSEAARRRGFPGAVDDRDNDLEPAVKGVRIGYQRGVHAPGAALRSFTAGELDDHRLAALLAGLLTIDWRDAPDAVLGGGRARSDPALDLLLPFTGTGPLRLPKEIPLRPGSEWPVLLCAGQVARVLHDAARRLRIAGLPRVIAPATAMHDGARLAAVLLLRVPDSDRLAALRRVAVLPEPTTEQNQEIPA